jgi:hypothetical protein
LEQRTSETEQGSPVTAKEHAYVKRELDGIEAAQADWERRARKAGWVRG